MLHNSIIIFLFLVMNLTINSYSQDVVINEIMSLNGSTMTDTDGDYSDWIELYNVGNQLVDLSGFG